MTQGGRGNAELRNERDNIQRLRPMHTPLRRTKAGKSMPSTAESVYPTAGTSPDAQRLAQGPDLLHQGVELLGPERLRTV